MNNLKFWSGKKKKNQNAKMFNVDTDFLLPPPPPPTTCYRYCNCCHHHHNHQDESRRHLIIQPLPSWIDFEQTHNTLLTREVSSGTWFSSMSEYSSTNQSESENDINATSLPVSTNCSYQESYKVENPVDGEPVLQPPPRRERCDGILGCGLKFGIHLIRCFCPCFHIHSVY